MNKTVKESAPRGRPVKNAMPEPIPDTPEKSRGRSCEPHPSNGIT